MDKSRRTIFAGSPCLDRSAEHVVSAGAVRLASPLPRRMAFLAMIILNPMCCLSVPALGQSIAAGSHHTCATSVSGEALCWGENSFGQLGNGTTTGHLIAVNVAGSCSAIARIDSSFIHSCALTVAGGVKCWGFNGAGQLGDNTTTTRTSPVDVVGLTSGVNAIAVGYNHSCALTTAGGVKCWGAGTSGQLGDSTVMNRLTPVDVVGLASGVIAIGAGASHTCAVTTNGAAQCWGTNFFGQLGDNTSTQRNAPVSVSGLSTGAAAILAGQDHTCALLTSGGVKCWGLNSQGQLGDNTNTQRLTPVDVSGLTSGIAAFDVGDSHNCAITTAGGLKCWGANANGQVGDGTNLNRLVPTDVSGLTSGVLAVSAGVAHSCAQMATGEIRCWGSNFNGQLGDGTTTNHLTPTPVLGSPFAQELIFCSGFDNENPASPAIGETNDSGQATSN